MNCVGRRCSLDLTLLWLCCRLAAAALILPLAWKPPYAAGVALKSKKQKKKEPRETGSLIYMAGGNLKWNSHSGKVGQFLKKTEHAITIHKTQQQHS